MSLKEPSQPKPLQDFLAGAPTPPLSWSRVGLWWLSDSARRHLPGAAGRVNRILSTLMLPQGSGLHLTTLMASQRYRPSASATDALRVVLERDDTPWARLMPDDISLDHAASRSVILRPPAETNGRRTPGVLLVKFTETTRFLTHRVDVERLQKYFRVVLEPSWSGYAVPELLALHGAGRPILVEAAEATDRTFLRRLGGALTPIAIGSGEWVDHRIFRPLDLDKRYGAVCVANYTPAKRVPAFLRALARIVRGGTPFRAALVCSRWGEGRDTVQACVRWYGLDEHVDVYESISQAQVNVVLNRSRCSVLMSLKEGSNRSLFEGMFAGTPGVLLEENVGVNKERFTPDSGVVVPEADLPSVLAAIGADERSFAPRRWALDHIAPEISTRRVHDELMRLFPEDEGAAPLLVKVNSPEARYLDEDLRDRQTPASRAVLEVMCRDVPDPGWDEVLRRVAPLSARAGPSTPADVELPDPEPRGP